LVIPQQQRKSYVGHSVWKISVETEAQAQALLSLGQSYGIQLDFWRELRRVPGTVDLRLSPEDKPTVKKFLDAQGMTFQIKVDDIDSLIQEEIKNTQKKDRLQSR
jgi:hypothetical protein